MQVQVRVSQEVNALLDDAVTLSMRGGASFVGVEHLFLAIAAKAELLPEPFMAAHGATLHQIEAWVHRSSWRGQLAHDTNEVYYTPRCAAVVNASSRLAARYRAEQAGVGHVLLALLLDPWALPTRALTRATNERQAMVESLEGLLRNQAQRSVAAESRKSAVTQTVQAREAGEGADGKPEEKLIDIADFTRDLTALARSGRLGAAVGRDKEIMSLVEIAARATKHNAIVVGEAGVGKTKIVEGLALACASGSLRGVLKQDRILELNISSLLSGTQYRGGFEEKVVALLKHLEDRPDTILFIDEIHLIMGAGATDGDSVDLANLLKPALGRDSLRVFGATTLKEYRRFIAKDPALERRFQMVRVESLSARATVHVLKALRPSLQEHHRVEILDESLHAAVSLTDRYLPNRQQPDKAIDALDQACARERIQWVVAQNTKTAPGAGIEGNITIADLRAVVSRMAGVPIEVITQEERQRLADLDKRLGQRIVGQDEAVQKAVSAIKKSRAGLGDPNRPDAVMLFVGPTGVGKTQLAKEMARVLFGSTSHLLSFDMSEYVEPHSVSKLIGAPPGYVGSEQEGLLTGAVQNKPFSIVLFDEIEKAHPQIFDVLLPVLEEGRLKDASGRVIDFRNCIIVFTSNAGADELTAGIDQWCYDRLLTAMREHFRPEFINRIDELVPFFPLLWEDVRAILKLMVDDLRRRLTDRRIGLRMYQGAYEHLADAGFSADFGARELRRAVERHIATPLSEKLLAGEFGDGDMVDILMEDGVLTFRKGAAKSSQNMAAVS